MPASKATMRAIAKYQQENVEQIHVKINRRTEPDIIKWLNYMGYMKSKQGYIKDLIRKDIQSRIDPIAISRQLHDKQYSICSDDDGYFIRDDITRWEIIRANTRNELLYNWYLETTCSIT